MSTPDQTAYLIECIEKLERENKLMLDNLTATQTRCTELINLVRKQTPIDIQNYAQQILNGTSRSYVQDAEILARYILGPK